MSNKNTNNRGFTLIEIIVVMAILGLLAVSTFVVFGNFNKKQNLSIAFDDVYNAISEAKSYALSQVIVDCVDLSGLGGVNRELVGYQVDFDTSTDPNTYTLTEVCMINGVLESPPNIIKTYSLPPSTNFDAITPIRFKVLSGGADRYGDVVVSESGGGVSRTIEVTAGGAIQEK